jgi:hypothetical protein
MNCMLGSTSLAENTPIYGRPKTTLSPEEARELRASYYDMMKKFIDKLVDLSARLKAMPDQERKPELEKQVRKANRFLDKWRSMPLHNEVSYCQGVMLPFFPLPSGAQSSLLVRIVPGDCSCFNTRKRVPYRIIMETIDPGELASRPPPADQSDTKSSGDFIDHAPTVLEASVPQDKYEEGG